MLKIKGVFRDKTSINIRGRGNRVFVEKGLTRLINCRITILGDNNTIHIGKGCKLTDASLHIEDDGGVITIGDGTIISGKTHLACIEGQTISIGEGCLFSANITLRTGDSHSIIDKDGKRINPSKDITIGTHVWVGNTVIILKGTIIKDNCVVATGSVLTGKEFPSNSIIGGVGGKVLKEKISWCEERIPMSSLYE